MFEEKADEEIERVEIEDCAPDGTEDKAEAEALHNDSGRDTLKYAVN